MDKEEEEEAYGMLKANRSSTGTKKKKKTTTTTAKGMTEEERREKIRVGLQQKKECESKALAIVERLLDPKVEQDWLGDAANHLTPSYYEDVTEERSCEKLCGFPLCSNRLEAVRPRQTYRISTRENRVYDITERKKFCSDGCFRRSARYKEQIPTSPLWLREVADRVVVRFLKEEEANALTTINGKGEPLHFEVISKEVIELLESNDAMEEGEVLEEGEEDSEAADIQKVEDNLKELSIVGDDTSDLSEVKDDNVENTKQSHSAAAEGNIEKRRHVKQIKRPQYKPKEEESLHPLKRVEYNVEEWFTIETLRLLEGDDFARQLLQGNVSRIEEIASSEEKTSEFRARYAELCRQLGLESNSVASSSSLDARAVEKEDNLKMAAFLQGKFGVVNEVVEKKEEEDLRPRLPQVDHYAQGALRRRLVRDQLDRVFQDVLSLCGGVLKQDVNDHLKRLIFSFHFSAENIVMRPHEWHLVAIILVKMIARMDKALMKSVQTKEVQKCLNLVLLSYDSSLVNLDGFISSLHTDILRLMEKMKTL